MSSLRISSLSNSKLDALLTQYGAATSGSTERKRERLQRFIDAQVDRDLADARLEIARQAEQQRVQTRAQARMAELRNAETGEPPLKRRRIEPVAEQPLRRSARLAAMQVESCPSPAPAPSPVRRPAPGRMVTRSMAAAAVSKRPPTPPRRTHGMTTRSQEAETRPAAREALQRIQALIAAFLA